MSEERSKPAAAMVKANARIDPPIMFLDWIFCFCRYRMVSGIESPHGFAAQAISPSSKPQPRIEMIVDEVDESTALVVRGACVRDGHFVADDQA